MSNLYSKIIFGELIIPQSVNKQAADMIEKVLKTSPDERLTLEEILYANI